MNSLVIGMNINQLPIKSMS